MKSLNKFKLLTNVLLIALIGISIIQANDVKAQCQASFNYVYSGNGSVTLTNSSTGGYTSTFWDFGDGTTAWWPQSSHTFPYNGTYNVCLTVADTASGCLSTFCDSITIINSNLTCTTTANSYYGGVLSYSFYSSTSGVQPFSYSWDFGDGNFSVQSSPYHTYAQNGIYNVIVIVTDAFGCTSSDTIIVDLTCTAGYTFLNNGNGNFSFSSVMNNSSTAYYWDFGDNTNSILSSSTHTYTNDGPYMVCLTVSDSILNCSATYCDTVVVTGTGNINCSFSYGASQSIPNGPTFNFWQFANGSNYFWDFGDGITSSQANPNHTYLAQGTYTYCLTVDSCPVVCGSVTAYNCQSNFYYYPDSLNVFDVIVVNNATGNNLTYIWNFGDGNTSTQQFPQHTYASTGNYYLCLTVDNGNGCVDTYCDSINASGINKTGFTINVIAPNSTSINKVEKNILSSLNAYPNPVNNNLTIELNLEEQSNIEVFITDLLGNQVSSINNGQMNAGNNELLWEPNNISNGIYLLNVKTNNSLQVKKIVLNR